MSEVLTQAEIDAFLKANKTDEEDESLLTPEERDALGEIGNISMGTAATTLYALVNKKVEITTPTVSIVDYSDLSKDYPIPHVAVEVSYSEGLEGNSLLILKERDVEVITDLMMGGDGTSISGELGEMQMSAIGEAMNQMVGASATSISSLINKKINILPPRPYIVDLTKQADNGNKEIIKICFKMVIGNVINSEIMQLMPIDFGKSLVKGLLSATYSDYESTNEINEDIGNKNDNQVNINPIIPQPISNTDIREKKKELEEREKNNTITRTTKVSTLKLNDFNREIIPDTNTKNINFLMDIPLKVSVEIGRAQKKIKEILDFTSGTIIELDKLAGELVDIFVNGKLIAKGEVVVIDENFGVRIIEIIDPLLGVTSKDLI